MAELETLDPQLLNAFQSDRTAPRHFDMRAFGDRLAIGLHVRDPNNTLTPAQLRLLAVDTAQIP